MPALSMLQSVVSEVADPLLNSADSVIEGHIHLNAEFLFLGAYPEIKLRKYDTPALSCKSSGKAAPQQCKHKGCGICLL